MFELVYGQNDSLDRIGGLRPQMVALPDSRWTSSLHRYCNTGRYLPKRQEYVEVVDMEDGDVVKASTSHDSRYFGDSIYAGGCKTTDFVA